jgi:hypothetical protein
MGRVSNLIATLTSDTSGTSATSGSQRAVRRLSHIGTVRDIKHMKNWAAPLLVVVMTALAFSVFGVSRAEAVSCSLSTPTTPKILSNGDVYSFGDASCTSSVYSNFWIKVVRVRTAWPDATVAIVYDSGTKKYWSGGAWGCEDAAAGASHRYKGKDYHSYLNWSKESDVVWLTCS